ncbi:MAG: histidine kinase [Vallitaleaceae bacterium]|nr:histidine kinase [Vallitaleaceae bacterium]
MKRNAFKIKKISLRITLYFSFVLIMIALVISLLNIRLYSDELSTQIDNVVEQKLSLMTGQLSKNIEDIKSIHSEMLNDTNIQNAFQQVVDGPTDTNILTLTTIIDNHPSLGANIQSVLALGLNGEIYNPISNFPAYVGLTKNNKDFEQISKEHQYFRLSEPNTFPLEFAEQRALKKRTNMTLFAQYFTDKTMALLGYLAINFRKSLLFDDIELLASETFSTTYIVDENDHIVHQIGDIPYTSFLKASQKDGKLHIKGATYSVLSKPIPSYERWHIITLFDRGQIKIETRHLNQYIYLILTIALIVMIFISWFISQKITKPIRSIVGSMNEFESGIWPEPLETKNEDEIKDLIYGYNTLITNFVKLTDDIIERHQENKKIEIDLIKTQIGLLEAQINPHFIHNTLNSMNYLALKENNRELSTLIESFNKLLHTSMAIDVSFVTVIQEIENIRDYARIQAVRFEEAFIIDYIIDPNASLGKIPKLILQPLVENSIIHGILPMSKIGHITISIEKIDEELLLRISDDGVGMAPERLQEMMLANNKKYVSKHIGVHNVIDRIKLYYGDTIFFEITSELGKGTNISFKIPYED